MAGKVFKFGANAATCNEKIKSNNREKHLEALQSALARLKRMFMYIEIKGMIMQLFLPYY